MLNNRFASYVAYFREVAAAHPQIKDFVHGTAADVMGRSRSDLQYPLLWLETPQVKISANGVGEISAARMGAFIILHNAPDRTPQDIDLIWEHTEELALHVLAKMLADSKARKFRFTADGTTLDPISTLFVDNDYGWRVELALDKFIDLCHKPENWA